MSRVVALAGSLVPETRVLDVGDVEMELPAANSFGAAAASWASTSVSRGSHGAEDISGTRFEILAADEQILDRLQEPAFDLVISTEVVEHLYAPRKWAAGCFNALRPGGQLICTTPYHGYLKNLVLSVLGRWDSHMSPLWDGGHIKLWSRQTLAHLPSQAGFTQLTFRGAGRLPYVWMTMILSARKPPTEP
jgi:SAM-dependent methyltransferase